MGDYLKPTPQHLEAICRLRGVRDADLFIGAIRDYERELTEQMVNATEAAHIHRLQGSVKALRTVTNVFETAPEDLRKVQQASQRNTQR